MPAVGRGADVLEKVAAGQSARGAIVRRYQEQRALPGRQFQCQGGDKAGPIGKLGVRERFHWLVAPKSTIVQTSPVHTGRCEDLDGELEHLMQQMVSRR